MTVVAAYKTWRKATHTAIPFNYPEQVLLDKKHAAVSAAAAHMFERLNTVFEVALPYMHACLHVGNYKKRDLVKTSAGSLEARNKRAKSHGTFASGWIPSSHEKAQQFSTSAAVLRAGVALEVAEKEVGWTKVGSIEAKRRRQAKEQQTVIVEGE